MLHICVTRLAELAPGARIQVLTSAPERLAIHCPTVEPLAAEGRYRWSDKAPHLPRTRRRARARLSRSGRRLARSEPAVAGLMEAMLGADLLLMSGRGGLTDAFPEETDAVLTEIEAAHRIGLPVVLLGQGVGPLANPVLRTRACDVLPGVALLAVREGRSAPALLQALGVPREQVLVTGDDAIELAYERRQEPTEEAVLGVNVRVAEYSGISQEDAEEAIALARATAARLGATIEPIEVSSHPLESDGDVIAAALGNRHAASGETRGGVIPLSTPVDAAGRCRVVVSGSYHAALFALAQGIPAVGIARTPYYVDKFLGLRAQFGDACRVVQLSASGGMEAIDAQVDELWALAPTVRPALLAAAEEQIALSRAACEMATALVAPAVPPRAAATVPR